LLIEGQAQNLIARSDSIDNAYWTKSNCTVTAAAAVGVTGALNACLITESEEVSPATAAHEFYSSIFGLSSATGCTVSLYCKSTGVPRLRLLSTIGGSTRNVIFDIANGTVVSEASATGAVESVGNGFYRISMTYTPTATTNGRLYLTFLDASNNVFYTGNGYNGVITSGFQFEMNSFASSFVSSDSGSATTRASDSASAVTADIGYTGGPVSVVVEANMQSPAANSNNRAVLELVKSGSTANRLLLYNYPGRADGVYAVADGVGTAALSGSISTDDYFKIGVSMDTNSIARSVNGGAITEDTSGQLPSDLNTLSIGCGAAGVVPIDGHIKRVALYSEALSDSNLISLTK
jgi:hypothetical protein